MRQMRIVHVYKDFDPPVHGGMERHMALMCRYQREWAKVEALTCSRSFSTRRVLRDGTKVTEVGEWGRFQSAPFSPMFPRHLKRMKADVMVVHMPNPTAELAFLMARPSARLVVRYQSDVVRQALAMRAYAPFQMKFLAKADIILPTSDTYMETSPTLLPFRSRCRVVPLGVVPEEFENPDPTLVQELKQRYGSPFVLFSGRHRYYKGLEYLVRAAPEIRARVVIAGEGPERKRLQSIAAEIGAKVAFPGPLSQRDLVAHLHACKVFVFPSIARSEAYGISILEAHACGTPAVATRLGTGVEFVNVDGMTGTNVPPRDSGALAGAVNELLTNRSLRQEYGAKARERVGARFEARAIARKEFDIYQEVFECNKTGI